MMLTKKLIAKIAVGIAVLIVIGFIIWKIRGKSTYSVESIKNSTDINSYEYKLYSNLSTCQNTFTDSTLGYLVAHKTVNCTGGTTVTVESLNPHEYQTGNSIYVQGVSSDGTTMTTTKGYNTLEGGDPVTVTRINDYRFSYTAVGGRCSADGSPTVTQNGYSWNSTTTTPDINNLNTIRIGCITSNISGFMDGMCPWAGATIPTLENAGPDAQAKVDAYNTYSTDHLDVIKTAYYNLILRADTVSTNPNKPSKAQVTAAREADFTAATRKYLNTVCNSFYKQTEQIDPGTNAVPGLPNTPYNAYQPSVTGTTVTSGSGFNPSLVTEASILAWAQYASARNAAGDFTGSAPLVAGSTLYDLEKPTTASIFPGMMNWQIAQDVGPGTVTTEGGIASLVRTA